MAVSLNCCIKAYADYLGPILSETLAECYTLNFACLVPQFTLDLVFELNPAVKDKIELPHRSGADFIPALVLTVPVGSEDITDLIRKNLLLLPDNPRGQEILSLFKIQGITLIKPEDLQMMVEIYNDYKKLR